jgi:uracil-DNA glycosylase family 4
MAQDLTHLPAFDPSYANCDACELKKSCDRNYSALAYRPKDFNGIMLVGEGPGQHEVIEGRPFVGKSGKLLRAMLKAVSINMDCCYITNATLCKPLSMDAKKGFLKLFPNAIPSCSSRLEAEIAAVRPKVIIGLGGVALAALAGFTTHHTKRVPNPCEACNDTRKDGPYLVCAARIPNESDDKKTFGHCKHPQKVAAELSDEDLEAFKAAGCPACERPYGKSVKPKLIKCLACQGRKTHEVPYSKWNCEYKISEIAGCVFTPSVADTPSAGELHKVFTDWGVIAVIPTYHPAFLLRNNQFHVDAVCNHLERARLFADGQIKEPYDAAPYTQITTDPALIDELFETAAEFDEPVSIDIETVAVEGGDARKTMQVASIQCIGFSLPTLPPTVVVCDTRECNPDDPNDALLNSIQRNMERPGKHVYQHGGGYDIPVIVRNWGLDSKALIANYYEDTLQLQAELYPDQPRELAHIAGSTIPIRAWKPSKAARGKLLVHGAFEELAIYNGRDTYYTGLAAEYLTKQLAAERLTKVNELDRQMRRIALQMHFDGVPISFEVLNDVRSTAQTKLTAALTQLHEVVQRNCPADVAEKFSPAGDVLSTVLYDSRCFQLPVISTTAKGAPQTDAPTLRTLLGSAADKEAVVFIKTLLEVRAHQKTVNTYLTDQGLQLWADHRAHPIWKPWGTVTGRFSSSPNFQNWMKWLRAIVVAPPGRKLVGADYSQLELRGLAALSGDRQLAKLCLEAVEERKLEPDYDPHSFVAALAFGREYTELHLKDPQHVDKDPRCVCQTCRRKTLRDITKRVIYGLNYGAGDNTVLEAIYNAPGGYHGPAITIRMIGIVRAAVYKAFNRVPTFFAELVAEAQRTNEVRSPIFGRRRVFPLGDIPTTEIYNFPIQSLAADLMNMNMLTLSQRLPDVDPTAMIILQVHDAVYVECAEEKAAAVVKLVQDTLTCTHEFIEGVPMVFGAAAHAADNWLKAA